MSSRRSFFVRPLLAAIIVATLFAPLGSGAASTPYRRYTFHGAGTVPGKFTVIIAASGGKQDNPQLKSLDPVHCFTDKNMVHGASEWIKEILDMLQGNPSAAHYGGTCRHIGWGSATIITNKGEVMILRQLCMEFRKGTGSLGWSGPDQNGRRVFLKAVDRGGADSVGYAFKGGIVQQDTLCGANNVPVYPLKGAFVSSDTGEF